MTRKFVPANIGPGGPSGTRRGCQSMKRLFVARTEGYRFKVREFAWSWGVALIGSNQAHPIWLHAQLRRWLDTRGVTAALVEHLNSQKRLRRMRCATSLISSRPSLRCRRASVSIGCSTLSAVRTSVRSTRKLHLSGVTTASPPALQGSSRSWPRSRRYAVPAGHYWRHTGGQEGANTLRPPLKVPRLCESSGSHSSL
jgi:hypothetical protein